MATEGADESNLHTEKKYQKDAKIGEGTYAVVYQGRIYEFSKLSHGDRR
jgi:cyclin-dependent kinase 7